MDASTPRRLDARSGDWPAFVRAVEEELASGAAGVLRLDAQIEKEIDLTRAVVAGLREMFRHAFPGAAGAPLALHHHVVARQGDHPEDHIAWLKVQKEKWIVWHGVRFVPDVLIRRHLPPSGEVPAPRSGDVLPIEIKFAKRASASQSVATAIGQCLAYTVRYDRAIALIGVKRGLTKGKFGLDLSAGATMAGAKVRDSLERSGVRLIFREVGS